MDPAILQLLTTGGAVTALAAVIILILRGDLVTKKSADALIAELTASRDEWKGLARESIADVGQLGEALTVRNRVDEALIAQINTLTKASR